MVVIFETRGGALLDDVEASQASWSVEANRADTVDATFLVESAKKDWANLLTPWKHSLAVNVGGRFFGGPIMPHAFDNDAGTLKVTARGIREMLAGRTVMPVAALTSSIVTDEGLPKPSMNTTISGFDLGTIGKKIVQQALAWPGWTDIPVDFHADRAGSRTRTYEAVDLKRVESALADLSGVENGPDIRFQLLADGSDGFRWLYESGTETQPRLQGASTHVWELDQASQLTVSTNPSRMGSVSWSIGGRSDDVVRSAMLYDPFLVSQGFPLLEMESDASSNTVLQATLESWNVEALRTARKPWEFWSFRVRTDQSPLPVEYNVGDLCEVIVPKNQPTAGGYIPAGSYTRRIQGLSGDEDTDWITITCGEFYG